MIRLVPPARGRITQPHGAKQLQDGRRHAGQDYGYNNNGVITDEVFAAADGVVLFAGDSRTLGWPNLMYLNPDFNRNDSVDSSAGNYIIIQHHEDKRPVALTGYAHLAAWTVKAGDKVKAGQRIGTIGNTGYSFGKHLHFDFMTYPLNYGTDTYGRVDPNPYFVTGLAAQGEITPTQEDEMSEADSKNIEKIVNKLETAIAMIENVAGGVNGIPSAVLDKQVPRVNSDATTSLALYLSYADADRDATVSRIQSAIASIPAPQLAADINAAGLAEAVRDELVKLLGGNK